MLFYLAPAAITFLLLGLYLRFLGPLGYVIVFAVAGLNVAFGGVALDAFEASVFTWQARKHTSTLVDSRDLPHFLWTEKSLLKGAVYFGALGAACLAVAPYVGLLLQGLWAYFNEFVRSFFP